MRQVRPGQRNEPLRTGQGQGQGHGSPVQHRAPEPATAANALDLPAIGRLVWSELPVLAVIDLLITLGVAVVAVVAMTVAALAPLVAAVLIGPVCCSMCQSRLAVGPEAASRSRLFPASSQRC